MVFLRIRSLKKIFARNGFHLQTRNLIFNISYEYLCVFLHGKPQGGQATENEPPLHTASNFVKEAFFVDLGSRGTLVVFAELVESLSFRVADPALFNYSFRYTRRNRSDSRVPRRAYRRRLWFRFGVTVDLTGEIASAANRSRETSINILNISCS